MWGVSRTASKKAELKRSSSYEAFLDRIVDYCCGCCFKWSSILIVPPSNCFMSSRSERAPKEVPLIILFIFLNSKSSSSFGRYLYRRLPCLVFLVTFLILRGRTCAFYLDFKLAISILNRCFFTLLEGILIDSSTACLLRMDLEVLNS